MKTCPILTAAETIKERVSTKQECLGEDCAWWKPEKEYYDEYGYVKEKGHCGVLYE